MTHLMTRICPIFYTFFHLVTSKYRRWNVFGDVFRILHVRIMSFYVSDELRRTLSTLPEKLRGLLWVRPFLTLHSEAEMFRTSLEIRIRWMNKMNNQINLWNQTTYWKILNSFNSIFSSLLKQFRLTVPNTYNATLPKNFIGIPTSKRVPGHSYCVLSIKLRYILF